MSRLNPATSPFIPSPALPPPTPPKAIPVADDGDDQDQDQGPAWVMLDISHMKITHLSDQIVQYDFLVSLKLNNNNLSTLPDCLGSLKNLTHLDLSYNRFKQLPPSVIDCRRIEELILSHNQLTDLPFELGRLYRITRLEVDFNPLVSPPASVVQQGTGAMFAYLRDRMRPSPPTKERGWIPIKPPVTKDSISVMCYNILADRYAQQERYPYCQCWALEWNYRKDRLVAEMLQHAPDVMCLQEVQADQYINFFEPTLSKNGYAGVYRPKSRARTMENWGLVDGCGIFYKRDRLQLVEEHLIEFQKAAMSRHKIFPDQESLGRLMIKDNIAVCAVLELIPQDNLRAIAGKPFKLLQNDSPKRRILVVNTHIHWDPSYSDVKLMQTILLLEELKLLLDKWKGTPVLLCGDLNSLPESGVYELLSTGTCNGGKKDFQNFHYGVYSTQGSSHNLNLRSAYSAVGEPFTNFTSDFVGCLDYIFYSSDILDLNKLLAPVDRETVEKYHSALPSPQFCSDHVPLLAELCFKK